MLSSLGVAACAPEPATVELAGFTMGTTYSIRVVRTDEAIALEPLRERITSRLEALENRYSTYLDSSEVSRFNAHRGNDWFQVSRELVELLNVARAVSERSGGTFDVTVGPLVELWGFGASGPVSAVPSQTEIDALLGATGFEHLETRASPPALRRVRAGVQIDLSAIAKGFAVDEVSRLFDDAGLDAYMIEIGGEVRARGPRADGADWSIGIESPADDGIGDGVPLRNAAIATSGDYRNYFEHEGRRYSHAIDPRTGWPVAHGLASVTVIHRTATEADAWATALLVLGPEQALSLARREAIAALLIVRAQDDFEMLRTPAWEASLAAL